MLYCRFSIDILCIYIL
ncbi:hypothetical protein [Plasmodium yoelii yoelii]|uniref:Uncharacterized protein n=1 Tax=Plasmodium yoelii yoelii TaxID=73239 RepID=Q7RSP0_PLAYO|nr:hypothetical protein [Plasmodium yoelii yoelii]